MANADFIIEAMTEDIALKRDFYTLLAEVVPKDVVLASNTSVIAIDLIASWVTGPERVLGMHFMNPVPMKPVVEVIRGRRTAEATIARSLALLDGMGKSGIVVNDSPGFVSNRILMPMINDAIGSSMKVLPSRLKSTLFLLNAWGIPWVRWQLQTSSDLTLFSDLCGRWGGSWPKTSIVLVRCWRRWLPQASSAERRGADFSFTA